MNVKVGQRGGGGGGGVRQTEHLPFFCLVNHNTFIDAVITIE